MEIIYKNRRQGPERRKPPSSDHVPERRSGLDRRSLEEKLKQLIEKDIKIVNQEKPAPVSSGSGTVILRKKNEDGTRDLHNNKRNRDQNRFQL